MVAPLERSETNSSATRLPLLVVGWLAGQPVSRIPGRLHQASQAPRPPQRAKADRGAFVELFYTTHESTSSVYPIVVASQMSAEAVGHFDSE